MGFVQIQNIIYVDLVVPGQPPQLRHDLLRREGGHGVVLADDEDGHEEKEDDGGQEVLEHVKVGAHLRQTFFWQKFWQKV
jgi:glycerol-3-phosphate cytidylyltransferase-like family protein